MKNFTLTATKNTTLASELFSLCKRNAMLLALLVFAICSESLFAQVGPLVINNGNAISASEYEENGVTPFAKGRNKSRVQYLYEKDEIDAMNGKTVTKVGFFVTALNVGVEGVVPLTNVNVKIYLLSNSKASDFKSAGTSSIEIPGNPAPVVEVFIPSLSITATGWVDIDLGAGFYKNPTDNNQKNIVVEICSDNTTNVALRNFSVKMVKIMTQKMARGRFNWDNSITALPTQDACSLPAVVSALNKTSKNYFGVIDRTRRPEIRFTFSCTPNSTPGDAHIADEGAGCPGSNVKLDVINADVVSGFTYQWQVSTTGAGPSFTDILGATNATLTIPREATDRYYLRKQKCTVDNLNVWLSNSIKVDGGLENVFNGVSWSLGEPTEFSTNSIRIANGTYTMSTNKKACSCSVNAGATLVVNGGNTLILDGPVRNIVGGGAIKLMNNASILQADGIVNSGKIEYYRNSQPMVQYDYTYWSSPVSDATVGSFAIGTEGTHIYSWNVVTQAWIAHNGASVMQPGVGYIVRAPEPATPAQANVPVIFNGKFAGVPNNGNYGVPVKAGQYALIGNPYPSAVDADMFIQDAFNQYYFDGTIYYWTHNSGPSTAFAGDGTYSNYTNDDYSAYNLLGGFPAPSNVTQGNPTQFIGAGQSFMVLGGEFTGNVRFSNDMRVGGTNNSQFYKAGNAKTTATQTPNTIEKHRVWLQLANATNFKQTLVGYATGATNGIDHGFDGKPMDGNALTFYSLIDAAKFTIQGRTLPFDVSDVVPLGYKTNVAGSHTISMYQFDGLFANTDVFLEDTVTGVIHNLKQGNYTFSTTAGTFDNRFKLKYSSSALSTDEVNAISNAVIVYKQGATLNIASQASMLKDVKIFDLSGRLLATKNKIGSNTIAFENNNWSNQVIIVQMITEDGTVTTKKVVF